MFAYATRRRHPSPGSGSSPTGSPRRSLLGAILLYVVFYSADPEAPHHRRTSSGAASPGACPCSSAGRPSPASLSWAPFILFLIIFLWTPPHYWPLSMKYQRRLRRRPACRCSRSCAAAPRSGLQVILYAWATVACSLPAHPGRAAWASSTPRPSLVVGGWFIYETHRLYNLAIRHEQVSPMRVFHGSIAYLSLLFLAVGDRPAAAVLRRARSRVGHAAGRRRPLGAADNYPPGA